MIGESNRIEYKAALTDRLEREVVAFLNYREGGCIYIGVDDDGRPVGLENIDETQLKVVDRIRNNIRPSTLGLFDVAVEDRDGRSVLKIIISSGTEKPYYIKSKGMSGTPSVNASVSSRNPRTKRFSTWS